MVFILGLCGKIDGVIWIILWLSDRVRRDMKMLSLVLLIMGIVAFIV